MEENIGQAGGRKRVILLLVVRKILLGKAGDELIHEGKKVEERIASWEEIERKLCR